MKTNIEIDQLYERAIAEHLYDDRRALLSGLDASVIAQLPLDAKPNAQLLLDLHGLNAMASLANGTVPLEIWIRNATYLSRERALRRGAPPILLVLTLTAALLGRLPRNPPAPTVAVEITEQTDRDLPGNPPFSAQPIPLPRIAGLLDKIAAHKPKAIALAIDLGAEGRSDDDLATLGAAIAQARAHAIRIVVPAGAASVLVAAAGNPPGEPDQEENFERSSVLLGLPVDGVPLGDSIPLALRLVAAEPKPFADAAILPFDLARADAVVNIVPAVAAALGAGGSFADAYVVLGGFIGAGRSGDASEPVRLYRSPWRITPVTTARAHAIVAACAAGDDLRWRTPWWPWLVGGLGAILAKVQRRFAAPAEGSTPPRVPLIAPSIELGLGAVAIAVVVFTSYNVPAWPLVLTALAGLLVQRIGRRRA